VELYPLPLYRSGLDDNAQKISNDKSPDELENEWNEKKRGSERKAIRHLIE